MESVTLNMETTLVTKRSEMVMKRKGDTRYNFRTDGFKWSPMWQIEMVIELT